MNGREERIAALDQVVDAVLAYLAAERRLHKDEKAAIAWTKAKADLELAARDLTTAVDDAPIAEWPKGWQITPDELP